MLKTQFIKEAKELGFAKYKELVKELGYHERTLDRVKMDGEITSKKFLKSYDEYKSTKNEKPQNKNIENKTPKKTQKVKTQKKHTNEENQEIIIHENQTQINDFIEEEKETHIDLGNHVHPQEATQKNTKKVEVVENKTIEKEIKKETGFIDISNEEYHGSGKMGVSKLKVMIDNAKEFYHKYVTKDMEQKQTDALIVGSLHHTLVLEPHKFDEEYTILNLPSRPVKTDYVEAVEKLGGEVELRENSKQEMVVADTVETLKKKLEDLTQLSKKTICTQAQVDLATQTSQKALNSWFELIVGGNTLLKAQLKTLLEHDKCYVEKTFYGEIDGVEVQVRPDILINLGSKHDVWFVIDLKTLEVATPNMFIKQGGAFFWHLQEAFYREVLAQNKIGVREFYFNCAGKKEFSGASFYEWGQTTKDDAKKVLTAGFKKYNYCTQNNIYLENRFDYKNVKFEAVATLEVPAYIQHQFGDMGI